MNVQCTAAQAGKCGLLQCYHKKPHAKESVWGGGSPHCCTEYISCEWSKTGKRVRCQKVKDKK